MRTPSDDRGVALLNVLAVVAVASAAALMMVVTQEQALDRSTAYREATQALTFARGGELSAVAALRRDMAEAPAVDHAREPWAEVEDEGVAIRDGRFTLRVEDAQSRFNINALVSSSPVGVGGFTRVLAAARLPPSYLEPLRLYVQANGPLGSPAELAGAGLPATALERLTPLLTALPPDAGVNVNSASAEMLGALLSNPVAGRLLVNRREATGFLTPADFEAIGVLTTPEMGFTSDHYRVVTEVQYRDERQRLVSLLRRRRVAGQPDVVVIRRTREAAGEDRAR